MKKSVEEFKKFIAKGSVIDLAVGVIIGSAFSAIVTSLVNNILTPLLGLILGGIDLSNLTFTFKDTSIEYGAFIQSIIDFLIISICIFIIIKAVNKLNHLKKKPEEAPKPKKTEELVVLEQIRDLLQEKKD